MQDENEGWEGNEKEKGKQIRPEREKGEGETRRARISSGENKSAGVPLIAAMMDARGDPVTRG